MQDYLSFLHDICLTKNAKKILELGVDKGTSTRVLLDACRKTGGELISVDIKDCSGVVSDNRWKFYQTDDRNFKFNEPLDILFTDTSHTYKHTLWELNTFGRLVREGGAIIIHDTKVRRLTTTKWQLILNAVLKCQFKFLLKQLWGHITEKDGVMRAIRTFLKQYPNEYIFMNYRDNDGWGVLTRIKDAN